LIVKGSLNDVDSDSGDIMAIPKSSISPFQLVLMSVSAAVGTPELDVERGWKALRRG